MSGMSTVEVSMRFSWFLTVATAVAACGGGGSSGSSAPTPLINASIGSTWSLDTVAPSQVGLTTAQVDDVLDHVFTDVALQSALLLKNGYVVGERYAAGYGRTDFGTSWSVGKSLYGAAIGVAIDENWITGLDQQASDFLDEWLATDKETITIRDILEMRAGFANEPIFFEFDQSAYAIERDPIGDPGISFRYSNNTSQLMEKIILRATGLNAHEYLRDKILTPIGIDTNRIGLWLDPTGFNPLTYCCIDMQPDDFARFGLLYSRGGEWDGSQLVSAAYVSTSLSAQSAFYGLQWWVLNETFFSESVPITVSAALGLDGQKIYVWPAEDVVLVVLTQYEHSRNQDYVLSTVNVPNTCTARNNCPGSSGGAVASFDEHELINLLAQLQ